MVHCIVCFIFEENIMKVNQIGRSMVEMLGVLAIIGVLSVGAIAGYAKAMNKYKLNKQTYQISSILDYVQVNLESLRKSSSETERYIAPFLTKLGIIPKEMIRPGDDLYVYDAFNNFIILGNYPSGKNFYFEMIVSILGNKDSCMNLFTIAKEKRKTIWRTKFYYVLSDKSGTGNEVYGDDYCTGNKKCLKDIKLTQAEEYCNICAEKETCTFYYQIKL